MPIIIPNDRYLVAVFARLLGHAMSTPQPFSAMHRAFIRTLMSTRCSSHVAVNRALASARSSVSK